MKNILMSLFLLVFHKDFSDISKIVCGSFFDKKM